MNLSISEQNEINHIEEQIRLLEEQKHELLTKINSKETQKNTLPEKNIVVIGGAGQLGSLFVKLFKAEHYQVDIVEADDWEKQETDSILAKADLVLVAVPIHFTLDIIAKLNQLSIHCILADITSIKNKPLTKMLEVHQGAVVGLHPMFGPGAENFNNQTIVVCHGRKKEEYQWLLHQLVQWQAKLHYTNAQKHDDTMAIVQVLRHFSTVAYGAHLAEENVDLDEVMAMSSPIYRLELAMVGRLFAQAPELYTEIIFSNYENIEMMQRYIQKFEALLSLLKTNNKHDFKQAFLNARDWFGDYAEKFLNDSNQMLSLNQKTNL